VITTVAVAVHALASVAVTV